MLRQRLVGVLIILVGFAVLYFAWPKALTVVSNYQDIQVARQTIEDGQTLKNDLSEFFTEYTNKKTEASGLEEAIPSEFRYADTVGLGSELAKRSGLILNSVSVSDTDRSKSVPAKGVEFSLAGNYQGLERFIRISEQIFPIIDVQSFNFQITEGDNLTKMTILFNYYYSN